MYWVIPQKIQIREGGGGGHAFSKKAPGILRFVTLYLPLEIADKMKLHPWKFHKIVLHPLDFLRPKTKTYHGNSFHIISLDAYDHLWVIPCKRGIGMRPTNSDFHQIWPFFISIIVVKLQNFSF